MLDMYANYKLNMLFNHSNIVAKYTQLYKYPITYNLIQTD